MSAPASIPTTETPEQTRKRLRKVASNAPAPPEVCPYIAESSASLISLVAAASNATA